VRVTHYLRSPEHGGFSIERVFEDVRAHLPGDIEVKVAVSKRLSKGFWPRVLDAIAAPRSRSQVNHVLGDVHYLTYFLPRRRTMLTIHDCASLERLGGWRLSLIWLLWYWLPLKRVSRLTVVSEFSRQSVLRWVRFAPDRITVIPPPLSPEFTYAPPRPHDRWRRLLHVGMASNKNLQRVIEAVAGLDVTLVTIGQIPEEIQAQIDRLGVSSENHHDLDRAAVVAQYRDADVLVFASTYEGFGMPIIEAQATGRPVVTSDLAPMNQVAGGAACLVDPFDAASIRAGIERVLSDESYAAGLIEAGRRNALQYGAELVAARYAALYREIAAAAGDSEVSR
jgi:glycosyltransferase involved in cell wall biosynthesis